jgi:hypothetical protein
MNQALDFTGRFAATPESGLGSNRNQMGSGGELEPFLKLTEI